MRFNNLTLLSQILRQGTGIDKMSEHEKTVLLVKYVAILQFRELRPKYFCDVSLTKT